jgi:integrase
MAFFLELAKSKSPRDLLFIRDDGRPWLRYYSAPFKDAVIRAGLPLEFCFHGLRHTYASQLAQAGAPLQAIADQLGHADIMSVSRNYAHLSPQIRESEVRQRFSVLNRRNARLAKEGKKALEKLRRSLHGGNWRTYAQIAYA